MTHNTLITAFSLSLVIGFPLGLLIFVLWIKRVFGKILNAKGPMGARVLFYSFPGLVVFIACCVPALYFNYLLKQEDYCKELIKVNPRMTKNDPDLLKRCSALDLDVLFKSARP